MMIYDSTDEKFVQFKFPFLIKSIRKTEYWRLKAGNCAHKKWKKYAENEQKRKIFHFKKKDILNKKKGACQFFSENLLALIVLDPNGIIK